MAGTSTASKSKILEPVPAQALQAQTQTQPRGQTYTQEVTQVPSRPQSQPILGPECGSSSLVRDAETGEVICTNCGIVLSDPTEQYVAPIPRRTEEGLLESQTGPPGRFSAFDKNLSTIISRAQASN